MKQLRELQFFSLVVDYSQSNGKNFRPLIQFLIFLVFRRWVHFTCILMAFVIPHLHIHARVSPRHMHEHSYASVSVRMNCFHTCTNIHIFVHINANELFSPFVPFDSCSKTASRASATNGKANDATNEEKNM